MSEQLPAEFIGAWRRESISVGNAEPAEPQQVWWLQTPVVFADLRLPAVSGAGPESFGGSTSLAPGSRLVWQRDLDLHDPAPAATPQDADDPGADTAAFSWSDGAMIEDGTASVFGAPVRYQEVWRRMPGGDGPCLSMRRDDGQLDRLVVIGDYALVTIGARGGSGHVGAAWQVADGTWMARGHWPPEAVPAPPPAPDVLARLANGDQLDGWTVELN